MDLNLAKCFICDVTCAAKSKNLGLNITRTLTMPLISVLTKCLRTFVEVDHEYFCHECTRKIEEYDNLAKLSLQIETELYKQFQNKPFKSSFLVDEIFANQSDIRDFLDHGPKIEDDISPPQTDGIDLTTKSTRKTRKSPSPVTDYESDSSDERSTSDKAEAQDIFEIIEIAERTVRTQLNQSIDPIESIENVDLFEDSNLNEPVDECNTEIVKSNDQIEIKKRRGRKRKPKFERISLKDWQTKCDGMKKKDWTQMGGRLTCDICGRTYKSKGALGVHMVKHSDQNPHGNFITNIFR